MKFNKQQIQKNKYKNKYVIRKIDTIWVNLSDINMKKII